MSLVPTLIDVGNDMYVLLPHNLSMNIRLTSPYSQSIKVRGNIENLSKLAGTVKTILPVLCFRRRGVVIFRLSLNASRRGLSHRFTISPPAHSQTSTQIEYAWKGRKTWSTLDYSTTPLYRPADDFPVFYLFLLVNSFH